jgi:hypothetical protein
MRKLVEVIQNSATSRNYSLREIFVNPEFVVSLVPDVNTKKLLSEGRLPEGLDSAVEFTRVTVHKGASGLEMVVVGDTTTIKSKLFAGSPSLLKG